MAIYNLPGMRPEHVFYNIFPAYRNVSFLVYKTACTCKETCGVAIMGYTAL